MTDREQINRVDAAGLWHAVKAYDDLVRTMKTMDFTVAQIEAEERRLTDAKRALRKIQKMRRAAAEIGRAGGG